jgi:hypothetical protein
MWRTHTLIAKDNVIVGPVVVRERDSEDEDGHLQPQGLVAALYRGLP